MDVRHDNNALQESNDCIGGLLHLGLNVITFRTLLHLGQLLHLGLQQTTRQSRYQGLFSSMLGVVMIQRVESFITTIQTGKKRFSCFGL